MRRVFTSVFTLILFISVGSAQADETGKKHSHNVNIEIPDVALVGIKGPAGNSTTISLTPETENIEAGEKIDFGTAQNSDLWLNYTSVVENQGKGNDNGKKRKIVAELDQNLPSAIDLFLEVGPANSGSGQTGTAKQEKISLKKGPSVVVDDIGSCYTESGEGKGHRLTYSLGVKDNQFDKVMAETFSVQVLYTITEN